ncbi:hypothetical protein CH063_00790 [Colletotrichum higginsianum]|nr:hypothetical protein CH063_00790 [Colletotrichum higginsianum]
MIGGSTFTGSSITPTTSPPPTASFPVSASLVTSFIDGVVSTWTVIGGSTVSRVLSETTSTPEQSAAVSVITSVFGGVGSTWTLVGGSTVTDSSSTSDTVTPTLPPGASIVTSIIGGIASSWTVIGGSTVFASTSSAFATLSATPTLPPGASVVTSIVGGIASSWTVIGGSTIFESTNPTQSTPTLPPGASIVTSIVDGMVSSWTVIGGSTIFVSASSALATPTLPPGATVITSVIGGVASSWTVIGGSTIFGSASPTDAAGATVITSVVGGVASSWTVIGGSTIFGSANNTAGVSPVASPTPSVFTSLVDGVASTWTVIGGSTIFGTLTQPSTSTGNTSTTPPSLSTSSSSSSSSSFSPSSATTSSSATPTSGYDSAFTGISVIVARNGSTCYVLPTPIASLHESLLNVTDREPPSIDAFYLDPATNSVKYLRLRDGNANPVLVDVSDPSRLAIIDGAGNVLSIDREGLHFTSANCSPKIDVFISGFFEQLAVLSGQSCRDTDEVPVNGTGGPSSSISVSKREVPLDARQERSFDVVLHLRDQCGDLVRPDLPVSVSLGDTECVVLPGAAGDFVASCAFPGGESNSMECETSVQQTLDHLTQGSLAGMCPSFASVWSLLSRELDRVVNFDTLLRPFIDAGLDLGSDAGRGLRSIIDGFMRLYDFSTSAFQNSTSDTGAGASSRLEDVIEEYGVAAIRTDVCRSLVSSETLALTFTAGASTAPVSLANISAVPSPRPEYERTVTDPTALACCPNASRCVVRDGQEFYPPEASIQGSDCLCGTTLEGRGVGFRTGRCVGYNQCNATSPCAGGAVCLVGSCCGFSVCVNGTECSAPAVGGGNENLASASTSKDVIITASRSLGFDPNNPPQAHRMAELKPTTAALPMELQLMIMRELADAHNSPTSRRRGIASYACVSKDWQAFFERLTFKHLIVRPNALPSFRQVTLDPRRQSLVRHVWLRIEKPRPDGEDGLVALDDGWSGSCSVESAIVLHLLTTLSTWTARGSGRGLTLELSSHTYVGLVRYAEYAPSDDLGRYSKYLETGSLGAYDGLEKFGHTSPKWHDEVASSASRLAGATSNLFTWGTVEFRAIQPPRVEVVTKLLMRRAGTRNIKATGLAQIIKSLPRLEEIHLERWRIGRATQEKRWLKGESPSSHEEKSHLIALLSFLNADYSFARTADFADHLEHGLPPSVKKLAVFHEEIDAPHYAYSLPFRAPREELDAFLARRTLHVECLSLCFVTEAESFFRHVLQATKVNLGSETDGPARANYTEPVPFRSLKLLTLTSTCFVPKEGPYWEVYSWQRSVDEVLLSAAVAMAGIPTLQLLEIWSGRDGHASIFRYKVNSNNNSANIVWSSTQDIGVMSSDVIEAWRTTATLSGGRRELKAEVVRLPRGEFEYHGSVLPYLDSQGWIVDPVSAAQIV